MNPRKYYTKKPSCHPGEICKGVRWGGEISIEKLFGQTRGWKKEGNAERNVPDKEGARGKGRVSGWCFASGIRIGSRPLDKFSPMSGESSIRAPKACGTRILGGSRG